MDSDLSLIEIAGEDDSLVQPIPAAGDAVSSLGAAAAARSNTADFFLCSPLQVLRSNSKQIEAASEGLEEAKRLFYRDGSNKENFNVEKAEALKLSVEPQQMKRKKKGGGYNLRKSLAWDRAFFTEEGVLDAAELSMISGSFSKSSGQILSAIEEESVSNFSDLQALEDNLFKELPPSTSKKTKENSGSLLPKKKNNEAPTSVASRKVLSTHDVNRSGSKRSACARLVASTSLKRPNLVTTKTAVKDSNVSKLPVQKLSPYAPPPSRIGKNSTLSAIDSKRSRITRPAVNAQKNCGLKGSLNKSKSVPNNSKAGPAGKSSTTKTPLGSAKRNVVSSVKCLPTTVQPTLNAEAQNDLGFIPNPTRPTGFPSNFHDGESGKIAIPLPQIMQDARKQTEKPTGLRRPSPSLQFFSQSKAPTSQSPLKLTSQPCNVPESNISNLRKPGSSTSVFTLKPPLAPRSFIEVTNYGTATGSIEASSSSSGYSFFSAVEPALHGKVESNPQVANMQKVEHKVVINEKNCVAIQSQNKLQDGPDQQSLEEAGQCTSKAIFEKVDQRNVESLLQQGTLQRLDKNDASRKVVDGFKESTKRSELEFQHFTSNSISEMEATGPLKSDITDHQLAEDNPNPLPLKNHGVSPGFTTINCSVNEPHVEQAEVVNLLICESDPIPSSSQMLQESVADVSLNAQASGVAELEKFNAFSHLRFSTEQKKDDTSALDKVAMQLSTEDAVVQSLDSNIAVNISNSELSPVVNIQQNMVVSDVTQKPELLEFPDSSLSRVEALEDGVTLHVDDCLIGENIIVPEEATCENVPPNDEREGTGACEREPKSSSDPFPVAVTLLDCGSNAAKLVENCNLDTQFQHVVGLHDETTHMELGNTDDHLTNVAAAEDVNVSAQESPLVCGSSINHTVEHADVKDIKLNASVESLCPGSNSQPVENFCPSQEDSLMVQVCDETTLMELVNTDDNLTNVVAAEDVNVSAQESPFMCGSSINHTVEHADVEDIKLNSSVESPCPGSTSPPVENFSRSQEDSLMVQVCVSSAAEDVNKQKEDEDKQIIPSCSEMNRIFCEEIQCIEANGLLFENTCSLEELQKLENGNSATVYLEVSSDEVSEQVNDDLSLHEKMDHVVEESVEVNDVVKDQDENFEIQFLVNQTEEEAKTSVAGIGLNQLSQEDLIAEVFNEENEFALQNCGDNEVEQMDDNAEVLNVENDFQKVVKQHDDHRIELRISTSCTHVAPVVQCGDLEEHKEGGSLEVESVTAGIGSLESEPPVVEQLSQNQEIENNKLSIEANSMRSDSWVKQSDNEVSGKSTPDGDHMDATRDHKKSATDKKQDNLVIKPPINAIPFSDEWLAAIEAAGEEILTSKSGAVQNSPQDRSQPEPGPWSPVKRKHNQPIGPFDCTKYTNH